MDGSLYDALEDHGAFREMEVKAMAYQVLQGLQYMHTQRRQLHRDVKPHNLLYNRAGWVKLSDFGISSSKVESWNNNARSTFCGTLVYMNPARAIEGGEYSYEADIWAFGVSIFQLALATLPCGNSIFEIMQLGSNPPRLPNDGRFSAQFADFTAKCLDPSATAATTCTVGDLLVHPWLADMTLEKSQRICAATFEEVRTRRSRKAHQAEVRSSANDIFASFDAAVADV